MQNKKLDPSQMSEHTRLRLQAQLADPEISDDQNPAYIFSLTATDLLLAIAAGLVDPVTLAHEMLANRGLDMNGQWVGFPAAREIHQTRRNDNGD